MEGESFSNHFSMITEYMITAAGLVLLGAPVLKLRRQGFLPFAFERVCDTERLRGLVVRSPWPWIAGMRAFIGAWLVRFGLEPSTGLMIHGAMPPWWTLFGFLLLGTLLLQMLYRTDDDAIMLPMGHVIGLMFVVLPWYVALPAIVFGLASAVAMRSVHAFCIVGSITAGIAGYFITQGVGLPLVGAAVMAFGTAVVMFAPRMLMVAVPPMPTKEENPLRDSAVAVQRQEGTRDGSAEFVRTAPFQGEQSTS